MKPIKNILMACGHMSQGITADGKYICIVCGCEEPWKYLEKHYLESRKARCIYCGKEKDSSEDLPFFEYKKDCEYDRYYCGCEGWD